MEDFVQYLLEHGVSQELIQMIMGSFTINNYPKGSIILSEGEKQKKVGIILSGVMRAYSLDENGQDITKHFSIENQWVCEYSLLDGSPSNYYYEAILDCQIAEVSIEKFWRTVQSNPILLKILILKSCEISEEAEEKIVQFQRESSLERYMSFLEKYPDLEERVNQEYIATYVGVTPSSLSRLKRKIKNNIGVKHEM